MFLLIALSTAASAINSPAVNKKETDNVDEFDLRGGFQINSYCPYGDHTLRVDYDGIFIDYESQSRYQIGQKGNYKRNGILFATFTAQIVCGGDVKHTESGFQVLGFVFL